MLNFEEIFPKFRELLENRGLFVREDAESFVHEKIFNYANNRRSTEISPAKLREWVRAYEQRLDSQAKDRHRSYTQARNRGRRKLDESI